MHRSFVPIVTVGLIALGMATVVPATGQTPVKTASRSGVAVRATTFDTLVAVSAGEAVTGTATSSSSAARVTVGILPLQRRLPTHVDEATAMAMHDALAPNPADGTCRLTLPVAGVSRTVSVVDGEGRRYYVTTVNRGATVVDLPTAGFPSGSYTVFCSDDRTSWSTRLVVVH